MTTVYFVRHAQTDYSNPIDKDRPLTAEGMQDRYLARDYMVKQGLIGQLTHICQQFQTGRRYGPADRRSRRSSGRGEGGIPGVDTARKGRRVLLDQSEGLGGFHISV